VLSINGQLIAPTIGLLFIAWTVIDLIRGKAFAPHRWWRYYTRFDVDPLDFSITGGFDLTIGLGITIVTAGDFSHRRRHFSHGGINL